jgi:hypothetical protein
MPRRVLPLTFGGLVFTAALLGLLSISPGVTGLTTPTLHVAAPHLLGIAPRVVVEPVQTQTPSPEPTPSAAPTTAPTVPPGAPVQPKNPPPPPPPPATGYNGPPATNPAEAVAHAYSAGAPRASRVSVALLDRTTGTMYSAGSIDSTYASASLVKVFIAARMLAEHRDTTQAIKDMMWKMITQSDDDAASALYYQVGAENLVPWIASRYQLSGIAPTNKPGWWGLTKITARAMALFYARAANDPDVGPWLTNAMANAQKYGSDGFYQYFGIPSATSGWRIKQGWMCCLDSKTRMHSTGFVDSDHYTVALLMEGSTSTYGSYGSTTLTVMAKALLPGGHIPQAPPPPPPSPSPSPSPSPTPSESESTALEPQLARF